MAETSARRSTVPDVVDEHDVAVAEHLHPVGDLAHLLEAVRDVDQRHAALAQAVHEGEEAVDLLGRERRRRLVEDQAACLVRERARDFDYLALADAERADRRIGVDVDAELAPVRARRGGAVHAS